VLGYDGVHRFRRSDVGQDRLEDDARIGGEAFGNLPLDRPQRLSWLSTTVMRRGPTARIWRTSSLPIDRRRR